MNENNSRKTVTNEDLAEKIDNLAVGLNARMDTIEDNLNLVIMSTAKGFEGVDRRFDEVVRENNARFDKIEYRMDRMGGQLDTMDVKVTTIESVQNRRLNTLEDKMHIVYAE